MAPRIARLTPALAFAFLASCDAQGQSNEMNGGAIVENAALAKLSLTSDAFRENQPIPARYSCDGGDERPALQWSEPPAGAKSFVLVIADPDAPSGTFRHWGVFDIPSSARSVGGSQKTGTEVTNDFGKPGYSGPCPPKGHGPHHYHFRLFALDVETLGLSPHARVADVEKAATTHAVGEGELVGTYERK